MPPADDPQRRRVRAANPHPPLSLRVWDGMRFTDAMRLLLRGRLAISPRRLYVAWFLFWLSLISSLLSAVQQVVYGRRIAAARFPAPPLFVVGHWRSGTTLLHELFALDPRFAAPTTYECLAPGHFLVSRRLLGPIARWFIPARRPMDDMPMGIEVPQEDEFALMAMGLPSPYTMIAFPNQGPRDTRYLDFVGVSARERQRWQRGLASFLRAVTVRRRTALVLKTPPHLGRLAVLRELFPEARFVHIVRDPYAVFPSTVRMWESMADAEAFHEPTGDGLEEWVFASFERLYRSFEAARPDVDPSRLADVRFDDLVGDPVATMERLYRELALGEFDAVRPRIVAYFAARVDYRPREYERNPEREAEIDRRWGPWMEPYGYSAERERTDA